MTLFSQSQLQAIADALGDTGDGLTGSEMAHLLASSKIADIDPSATKRIRLYNALATYQNQGQERGHILGFIRRAMKPERFARCPERFEPMRLRLNQALSFAGMAVDAAGVLSQVEQARTLSEAQRRARVLRADLTTRGVHPDVLRFCREELVADNYFHAVLEAAKSVADKMREKTGLSDDGAALVDRTLAGSPPLIAINRFISESEKGEQKGFANLVRGMFGMFRNPTAHEARIKWSMTKDDAEDLFSLVSLMHRRLDNSHMPPRV